VREVEGRRGVSLHLRRDDQGRRNGSLPKRCTRLWSVHQRLGHGQHYPMASSHTKGTFCRV
jgi:hypothetical protein